MNEINNSDFRKESDDEFQYSKMVITHSRYSASLSTCQMVVVLFGNYHRFKTIFCCYLNDKIDGN